MVNKLSRLHPMFNAKLRKKYLKNNYYKFLQQNRIKPGLLSAFKNKQFYKVDKIIASKSNPRKVEITYRVKWIGRGNKDS